MPTPPQILVAEPLGNEGLELLQQKAHVDVRLKLSADELKALVPSYHALIVRSGVKVTEALLQAGQNLVVVGRAGVGVDNIDVPAATRRGITVVNAPTTNIVAAAEHTVALMYALARKIPQADSSLRARQWQREKFVGVELVGKQLGLVGLGRVGSEVARRAVGLGMEVVAFDPYVSAERAQAMQVKLVSLDELLATSDFVSLHAPVTRETKKLIGAREFELMKPGARLLNVARGALLDEGALLAALDAGRLAGAALDVFEHEPPDDERLRQDPRVVITPHIGGSTQESQVRVGIEIAGEVLAVLEGRPARFAVNAPLVPPSLAPQLPPHIELAERLGRFYIQWVGGPLDAIEIEYAGTLADEETAVLTAAVIKGLLEPIHEDRVNLVNAQLVAQMHGLRVSERKTHGAARFENLISVRGARRVTGTVLQNQPHIVHLDGYWVDFVPEGYLLLMRHRDRPGMIGRVGTSLGNADVNIASMQVARDAPRGEAIMILNLDDPVPDPVFEKLREESDIEWVKVLQL
ncbi:MAG: phosphoglycerate dehydrogenase [Chloroflexi bacterium]|nr:phosphoglycerate dehydrogenase [Chloroflexota bacterium]